MLYILGSTKHLLWLKVKAYRAMSLKVQSAMSQARRKMHPWQRSQARCALHANPLEAQHWLPPEGQALVLAVIHRPGLVRDLVRQRQLQAQGGSDWCSAPWAAPVLGQAIARPWRGTGGRAARAGKRQWRLSSE